MKSSSDRDPGRDGASILRQRARALARPVEHAPEAAVTLEVLEFRLAHEHYAVETRLVRDVVPFRAFTPLPGVPAFVVGVVNVRGRVLPVINLKEFFELPDTGLTDLHRTIVVRRAGVELGLLADISLGVRTVSMDALQTSLPTVTGVRDDFLRGVTGDRLVVLDLDAILADDRLIVDDAADG